MYKSIMTLSRLWLKSPSLFCFGFVRIKLLHFKISHDKFKKTGDFYMKKIAIIVSIICAIVTVIGLLWFIYAMHNQIENMTQEETVLHQKAQALEEKLTAVQDKLKKETFVNPLFYKKLEAVGAQSSDVYITPKSCASLNYTWRAGENQYDAGWDYANCDLLENEQDYVIMYCRKRKIAVFYRYTIKPCGNKDKYLECQYKIIEESTDRKEDLGRLGSLSTYVISK